MTTLITYHEKTTNLALFESNGDYWIGSYSPFLTHQSDEPDYVWVRGDFTNEEEGRTALETLTVDEF